MWLVVFSQVLLISSIVFTGFCLSLAVCTQVFGLSTKVTANRRCTIYMFVATFCLVGSFGLYSAGLTYGPNRCSVVCVCITVV